LNWAARTRRDETRRHEGAWACCPVCCVLCSSGPVDFFKLAPGGGGARLASPRRLVCQCLPSVAPESRAEPQGPPGPDGEIARLTA
jgi:hypothetical protein